MNLLLVLFLMYMAFSVVATAFYLAQVGFSKDDLFVLTMDRVEQKRFLLSFIGVFLIVVFNLLNFYII